MDNCRTEFEPWEDYYDLLEAKENGHPELRKFFNHQKEGIIISEFLYWMGHHGYTLSKLEHNDNCCTWSYPELECDCEPLFIPTMTSDDKIIANFLGLDINQIRKERKDILEWNT